MRITSIEGLHRVGRFLADSGYDVPHLGEGLGLSDGLYADKSNLEVLLHKTSGDSLVTVLARLFFVGVPVDATLCRRVIPEEILAEALDAGLLKPLDSQIEPRCILLPFENLIVACDAPRLRGNDGGIVVGPSGSTRLISRSAIRGTAEETLDLGTGSGVLALQAASYSSRVLGTDINERAILYAKLGAALNGIRNVEFAAGDAFAPAEGQRFSRIIANPPFFLSPAKKFIYSDSPMELDGFTKRLAMEAPQYLKDGGFFQMLCEWVQVENQPWEDRLREWTHKSNCDVLVLQGTRLKPVEYAEKRLNEAKLLHGDAAPNLFAERIAYFQDRRVETIFGGVITMRKRSGANWFTTIMGADAGANSMGEGIQERFETLELVATYSQSDLLRTKFRFTSDTAFEQRKLIGDTGWQTVSNELVKSGGLRDRLRLDAVVAEFAGLFDGQHTLGQMAQTVSESLRIPVPEAEQKCLQLARRLLQGGFINNC